MIETGNVFSTFLVNALWQIPLITLPAYLLGNLFKGALPKLNYRYWLFIVLLALVLPAASSIPTIQTGQILEVLPLVSFRLVASEPAESDGVGAAVLPGRVVYALSLIFLLLFGLALFRLVRPVIAIWRLNRNSLELRRDQAFRVFKHCAQILGVRRARLCVSDQVSIPQTFGFFIPTVLLPSELARTASDPSLETMIGHELAHIRRHDFQIHFLTEIFLLPIAFHPAVHLIRAQLRRFREFACDEIVVEELQTKRAYAKELLSIAQARLSNQLADGQLSLGQDFLEERIERLLQRRTEMKSKQSIQKTAVFASSLLLFMLATFGAGLGLATSSSQESQEKKVYDVAEEGITKPRPLERKIPSYTRDAKEAGIEGVVVLECIIRTTGRVTDCTVKRELDGGLEKSAIEEIENNWHFEPGRREGEAVDVRAFIEIQFTLEE